MAHDTGDNDKILSNAPNSNLEFSDIHPDFSKKSLDYDSKKRADEAINDLKDAENSAVGVNNVNPNDDINGARKAEENGGFYKPTADTNNTKQKGKTTLKGKFKKYSALAGIIAMLGGGTALLGSQAFQGFALVNNAISQYDVSSYTTTARFKNAIKKALKGEEKIKKTGEVEDALNRSGIEVTGTDEAGNISEVSYHNTTGEEITVNGSNIDTELNGGSFENKLTNAGQLADNSTMYTSTAKTKGQEIIGVEGNRYAEIDAKDADPEIKTEENITNVADSDIAPTNVQTKTIEGEEGKNNRKETVDKEGTISSKNSEEVNKKTMTDYAEKMQKASVIANLVAGATCIGSAIVTGITAMIIGQQVMEMVNFSSGSAEAIQKVQAGEGDGTSMSYYLNNFGSNFWTSDGIGGLFDKNLTQNNGGDANLEGLLPFSGKTIMTAWGACLAATTTANILSLIATMMTGGLGKAVDMVFGVVVAIGASSVVGLATEAIIKSAVERVGIQPIKDMNTENAGNYWAGGMNYQLSFMAQSTGTPAGNEEAVAEFGKYRDSVIALQADYDRENLSPFDVSSKNTFLGSIANSFMSFAVLNSNNTILSSIKSTGKILSNSASTLLPSVSAATYTGYDIGRNGNCKISEVSGATGTNLNCITNIVSDTNTYNITHEEAEQWLCNHGQLKCELGKPKVVEGSELAKYISFWTTRTSHVGLPDSNITAIAVGTGSQKMDSIKGAIGYVPVVGDVISLIDTKQKVENKDYIFGDAYVIGSEKWKGENSENKNIMKYIEVYLETETIYQELGLIESSAFADYLEEYFEKNPIDNSYEGRLARFSGMTKDEVEDTLAKIDYLIYLAEDYNPLDCYAFSGEKTSLEFIQADIEYDDSDMIGEYIAYDSSAYFTTKNDYYTVA